MNKLYYSPGACSLAVDIVLVWIGELCETVRVDLDHRPVDYRRINRSGAVSAIDHGGPVALTQASAVLNHLCT